MKIVYCTDSVYRMGGIELVTIAKANALAAIPGNQVWIALADNSHSAITRLSKVSVLDLAVHYYENDGKGFWLDTMDFWKKRRFHRHRLEQMLNDINPDVVISTGLSTRYFLTELKIQSNPVFIREMHFTRLYRQHHARGFRKSFFARISEMRDYGFAIKKFDKIVVLTEADKTGSWKNWNKVTVMPNPLIKQAKEHSVGTNKVAITASRWVWAKNYDSLIYIWAKVVQRHPDWVLQIWGEGPEENHLRELVDKMGLMNHVFLMGSTHNVQEQMAKASLFVLTSRTEGFSLVAIEAMSVGIPAVVYNCPGGIRYVVKDGETGFLVPMDDEDAFVEKVCTLIENENLRRTMGQAALKEVEQYRIEKITQRWMDLFQELLDKKRGKRSDAVV